MSRVRHLFLGDRIELFTQLEYLNYLAGFSINGYNVVCTGRLSSNSEIEERWIEAWKDLFDIVGKRWQVSRLLPDVSIVDIETCQGWLQESAYQCYSLKVEAVWVKGERGIVVSRFKEGEPL